MRYCNTHFYTLSVIVVDCQCLLQITWPSFIDEFSCPHLPAFGQSLSLSVEGNHLLRGTSLRRRPHPFIEKGNMRMHNADADAQWRASTYLVMNRVDKPTNTSAACGQYIDREREREREREETVSQGVGRLSLQEDQIDIRSCRRRSWSKHTLFETGPFGSETYEVENQQR